VDVPESEIMIYCGIRRIEAVLRAQQQQQQQQQVMNKTISSKYCQLYDVEFVARRFYFY